MRFILFYTKIYLNPYHAGLFRAKLLPNFYPINLQDSRNNCLLNANKVDNRVDPDQLVSQKLADQEPHCSL